MSNSTHFYRYKIPNCEIEILWSPVFVNFLIHNIVKIKYFLFQIIFWLNCCSLVVQKFISNKNLYDYKSMITYLFIDQIKIWLVSICKWHIFIGFQSPSLFLFQILMVHRMHISIPMKKERMGLKQLFRLSLLNTEQINL